MVVLDAAYVGTAIAAAETGGAVAALTAGESLAVAASVTTSIVNNGWAMLLLGAVVSPVVIIGGVAVVGQEIDGNFDLLDSFNQDQFDIGSNDFDASVDFVS